MRRPPLREESLISFFLVVDGTAPEVCSHSSSCCQQRLLLQCDVRLEECRKMLQHPIKAPGCCQQCNPFIEALHTLRGSMLYKAEAVHPSELLCLLALPTVECGASWECRHPRASCERHAEDSSLVKVSTRVWSPSLLLRRLVSVFVWICVWIEFIDM